MKYCISRVLLTVSVLSCWPVFLPASAQEECCSQPGRIESAKHLIAQSEKFKLKASQFHLGASDAINNAKKLQGQAEKLRGISGSVDAGAPKEYQANLQAFKDHATQYKAHLNQVEQQLGFCKASEAEYKQQLKDYSLHVEQFHMPNIRPPHICGQLQISQQQASQIANSMRADQQRLMRSEAELANTEANLENAMQSSMGADASLYHRSQLAEAERKLAGEFASLKTEYELLKIQHDSLSGAKTPAASFKSVRGKIK